MDANRKPQMTREMVMRLSGSRNGSVDGFKTYAATGRSLSANRQVNSDRRYIENYRTSMAANNSTNIRRFGAEMGIVAPANNTADGLLPKNNRQINVVKPSRNKNSATSCSSRQPFNASSSRPVFREPPPRRYNPFG